MLELCTQIHSLIKAYYYYVLAKFLILEQICCNIYQIHNLTQWVHTYTDLTSHNCCELGSQCHSYHTPYVALRIGHMYIGLVARRQSECSIQIPLPTGRYSLLPNRNFCKIFGNILQRPFSFQPPKILRIPCSQQCEYNPSHVRPQLCYNTHATTRQTWSWL